MTRNVHLFVLCVAGLALGGCYDHRTVAESDISPINVEEDAGVEQPDNNGGNNDGDNGEGNGADNQGDEGDEGQGPFGDLDCENPPDELTELLCGLQEGADNAGQNPGGFPGAPGGQPGGSTGGRPGPTTGGQGPTTGGIPGLPTGGANGPTDPAEIIQEIIDNLDCDQKEPDILTQLLCALTEGGGGGFPGGGGSGFPGF